MRPAPIPPHTSPSRAVLFFGNKLTLQTKLGTAIALLGTYAYTEAVKRYKAPAKTA